MTEVFGAFLDKHNSNQLGSNSNDSTYGRARSKAATTGVSFDKTGRVRRVTRLVEVTNAGNHYYRP